MTLISENYRAEQERLHARGNYGTASLQFGRQVSELINSTGAKTLLDYGCGSMQNLRTVLRPAHDVEYTGYDPGVPAFSERPEPADVVACIDVLEHIEPEYLDEVLADLRKLTKRHAFVTIHTGPAVKTLSDGRNAHLIQKPGEWWFQMLAALFEVVIYQRMPNGALFILEA